ncbi:hypothetical protein KP77_08940 [Jeotgalibacillus alimentarius]|uniref:Uncharacterized protein n=1 Tax=Jeotgalibacillus alimentarius TaxID=135826 RepID=A0A0C2VR31_9BACL|nr:hypothetical protein [Jeotgalibacillus alimentarius]KIL51382.1 hypothetical protein KP77_08940 [Jeotgalibacillus alimentarius]
MSYSTFRWIHIILSGIATIPFTLYAATGFIGESYEDELFLIPELLILIVIWLIGAILMFFSKTKLIGMILTTLPIVFYAAVIVYFLFIPALTY